MKYLVVIGDGMADFPVEALSGKTKIEQMFLVRKRKKFH